VVGELACPPTPPWGLGSTFGPRVAAVVATESLEPGDGVLFYTDGVIEAHPVGGAPFGLERLADIAGRHASDQLEPEENVRHIIRAVLDHQEAELADDATLVLVRWNGPADPAP
jgi:serine phosphatase RsbU (regulator of sigma subunit)